MRTDLFDFELPEEPHRAASREPARCGAAARRARRARRRCEDRVVRDLPRCCVPATRWCSTTRASFRRRSRACAGAASSPRTLRSTLHRAASMQSRWRALARPAKRLAGRATACASAHDGKRRACRRARRDRRRRAARAARSNSPSISPAPISTRRSPTRRRRCRCRPTSPAGARRTSATARDYQTVYARARRRRRRADRGAALHARAAGGAGGARHLAPLRHAARRRRHVPAGEGRRHGEHSMHAEWGEVSAETAAALNAVARARRAHRRGRHHVAAAARERGDDDGEIRPFAGETDDLHHARLPLPRRRPADDQLPPAALDAVHAGRGLRRAATRCRRPTRTPSRSGYRFYSYGDACLLFPSIPTAALRFPSPRGRGRLDARQRDSRVRGGATW